MLFTPGNVSISSKHILPFLDNGHCVVFPVTKTVESVDGPAVRGGAVTQLPVCMVANGRCEELMKVSFIKFVACYDDGVQQNLCERKPEARLARIISEPLYIWLDKSFEFGYSILTAG